MDMGAEGDVAHSRLGRRGASYSQRHEIRPRAGAASLFRFHDRRPGAVTEKFAAANRRNTLFCQIETAEGGRTLTRSRRCRKVDASGRPHFDLRALGVPGEFGSKEFADAIARVVAAARKHGKSLGRLVPTVQQGIEFNAQGFDFICYSGDVWVLHDALAEAISKLREGCSAAKTRKKS
jgi:2-dehydro-3-deoxyglucarate aldolase/4-hydroxy-2-oxoheptanedioate aldolase